MKFPIALVLMVVSGSASAWDERCAIAENTFALAQINADLASLSSTVREKFWDMSAAAAGGDVPYPLKKMDNEQNENAMRNLFRAAVIARDICGRGNTNRPTPNIGDWDRESFDNYLIEREKQLIQGLGED